MKKLIALMLAAVMLLSLCACGKKDSADDSTPSTSALGDTQAATEDKTENTQPSGSNETTAPTTPVATTPAATTPAATTPAPTGCSHSNWKAATCTAPKTCSNCGITEGSALGHEYKDGSCTKCGADDDRVPFSDHIWSTDVLSGNQLNRISLDCYKGTGMMNVSFWSENGSMGEAYQFGGKTYYEDGFGKDAEINYMEEGDTIQVTVSAYDGETNGTITLKRANSTQDTVSAISGTIISDSITGALKVGTAFTVFILNIN